jgi:hypothetical protein
VQIVSIDNDTELIVESRKQGQRADDPHKRTPMSICQQSRLVLRSASRALTHSFLCVFMRRDGCAGCDTARASVQPE